MASYNFVSRKKRKSRVSVSHSSFPMSSLEGPPTSSPGSQNHRGEDPGNQVARSIVLELLAGLLYTDCAWQKKKKKGISCISCFVLTRTVTKKTAKKYKKRRINVTHFPSRPRLPARPHPEERRADGRTQAVQHARAREINLPPGNVGFLCNVVFFARVSNSDQL